MKRLINTINLFLLMLIPAVLNAQFKRSATELAKENIQEYLTTKLFKDQPYKAISYGELMGRRERSNSSIAWSITHRFAITEMESIADKKMPVEKLHQFMFYFDDKMNVIRAESYF